MPSDAELEARGAVIGTIEIDSANIFDEIDPRETPPCSGSQTGCTCAPSPPTIRAQLLFTTGRRYSARKLAETERELRRLLFIYDARVVPVRYARRQGRHQGHHARTFGP